MSDRRDDLYHNGIVFDADGSPSFAGAFNRRVGKLWQRLTKRYFNSRLSHAKECRLRDSAAKSARTTTEGV
jgi:hypothetical protein